MSNVRTCLSQKSNILHSVSPDDSVKDALQKMRDNRVRAILVIEGGELVGIVSQGDCAIKVLLPGKQAGDTLIRSVMTANPITVTEAHELDHCMAIMASRNIRHLPVARAGKVVGVISIGDIVKNIIEQQGDQIKFLETYIRGHGAS
jgi:CBS domain-containing protein